MSTAKTQKALGILEGIPWLLSVKGTAPLTRSTRHLLVKNKQDVAVLFDCNAYSRPSLPAFARPCPIRPRHGFVESRTVNTVVEINALLDQIHKEDPKGELLLGPNYRQVNQNAVYVSSGVLSVGPGNDGATSGKGSISFPVAPYADKQLKSKSGVKRKEEMYIESILPEGHTTWVLTQIRGGPAIDSGSEDFVPKSVVVNKIITPCADLLQWEKEVAKIGKNVVVYGNGHTLASHAAVHCILHDIPFIVSHKPKVGEIIESTERNKPKHTMSRSQFKKGVYLAVKRQFAYRGRYGDNLEGSTRFCFSVLHNWFRLKDSPHASWLLGLAVATFAKICAALVLGEYRHHDNAMFPLLDDRTQVYSKVVSNSGRYIPMLPKVLEHFYSAEWASGFGGIPWANCSWHTIEMWRAIIKEYNAKGKEMPGKDIAGLMDVMNRTINQAHNNGWWFNKVWSKADMDFAANEPALTALSVADFFYNATKEVEKIKSTKGLRLRQIRRKSNIPCGKNAKQKLVWAYFRMSRYDMKYYKSARNKSIEVTLFPEIYEEGSGLSTEDKEIKITTRQLIASCRKRVNDSGRVFLDVVPKKGFRVPGGAIIQYKGIMPT